MVVAANFAFAQIKPKEEEFVPPFDDHVENDIKTKDSLITEKEVLENLEEGTDRENEIKEEPEISQDIYDEKPKEQRPQKPTRPGGYW